jgi:CRP/FNR family nitrogen fixation transcriptional regulator
MTVHTSPRDYQRHTAPAAMVPSRPQLRRRTFEAGAQIFAQGDAPGRLYQVVTGTVLVSRLLEDGRRQVVAFHLPGEVFGLEARDRHHFTAEAVGMTCVESWLPDAASGSALLALALDSLSRVQSHLLILGGQSATGRVAGFLLDIAARQGTPDLADLSMTRTDIADYLGVTMETVSRELARLKAMGLIAIERARRVTLRDRRSLHALLA